MHRKASTTSTDRLVFSVATPSACGVLVSVYRATVDECLDQSIEVSFHVEPEGIVEVTWLQYKGERARRSMAIILPSGRARGGSTGSRACQRARGGTARSAERARRPPPVLVSLNR